MVHDLRAGNYQFPGDLTGSDSQPHESINHAALALTPPLHLLHRTQRAAITSAEWESTHSLICSVPVYGLACPKIRSEGLLRD